jgi:TIR domain
MKITIYRDSSVNLDVDCIVENIPRIAPELSIAKGATQFSLEDMVVSFPQSYMHLSPAINQECEGSDQVLLFTEKRYDNNYFWQPFENKSIISFSGWEFLTTISRNNGAVYFLCSNLLKNLGVGVRHDENRGCINDFWLDKTGVDTGMRSAFICPTCMNHFRRGATSSQRDLVDQVQAVLDDLSAASRAGMNICDYWKLKAPVKVFDVFLCHNSQDKEAVRDMNARLQVQGIKTWFDEEQLPPGRLWQEILEEQIEHIRTAAVLVGPSGVGPWQQMELRAFLEEFVSRRCPVIPVILADCMTVPQLPIFLRQLTWVDLRKTTPDPFKLLLWGITGRRT